LLRDGFDEDPIGEHPDAFGRHEAVEPLDGGLNHGLFAGQVQQLLGARHAAGRPESGAGSAGHDHGV